jgi:hypothetical protein
MRHFALLMNDKERHPMTFPTQFEFSPGRRPVDVSHANDRVAVIDFATQGDNAQPWRFLHGNWTSRLAWKALIP